MRIFGARTHRSGPTNHRQSACAETLAAGLRRTWQTLSRVSKLMSMTGFDRLGFYGRRVRHASHSRERRDGRLFIQGDCMSFEDTHLSGGGAHPRAIAKNQHNRSQRLVAPKNSLMVGRLTANPGPDGQIERFSALEGRGFER